MRTTWPVKSLLVKSLLAGAAFAVAAALPVPAAQTQTAHAPTSQAPTSQAQAARNANSTTIDIAARKKTKAARRSAKLRRASAPHQIACPRTGCQPIPRNCHSETEVDFRGTPTGFDLVVCR